MEDPCPLPARKLARNAQHGFGFYIGLAVRQEGKGTRAIRIDADLLSERTPLGQLDRNEAKIAAAITFADEAAAARAEDAYAVEQDQAVRRVDAAARPFGSTTIDCSACMEKANTRGRAGATGVIVALEPVSKMADDITDGRALRGNLSLSGNSILLATDIESGDAPALCERSVA